MCQPLADERTHGRTSSKFKAGFTASLPVAHMGSPDEIANAGSFLASNDGSYCKWLASSDSLIVAAPNDLHRCRTISVTTIVVSPHEPTVVGKRHSIS
jgi:hypothetical protein